MTRYLDTSLLVAALTNETRTEAVQAWLGKQKPGALFVSDWVATEFSAALSLKIRTGQIAEEHRASALSAFARLNAESLTVLPIAASQFRTAARFADQHALGLRAGDALHLAVAAECGAVLCTLDVKLARAGSSVGVQTVLL